jgi:hypothetical protein
MRSQKSMSSPKKLGLCSLLHDDHPLSLGHGAIIWTRSAKLKTAYLGNLFFYIPEKESRLPPAIAAARVLAR